MTALLLLIIAILIFGVGGVMKGLVWAFILGAAFFIAAALAGFATTRRG
ncbi:MAG: hypothetical protein WC184_07785 [Acidimicrobiia bacterium]